VLRRFIVLCVICNIALFSAVEAPAANDRSELQQELEILHNEFDSYRSKLQKTRSQREETQEKLQKARSQEKSLLSLLKNYRNEIETTRRRLSRKNRQKKKAQERLRKVSQEIDKLESLLKEREKLLHKRLRGIYKQGELMHSEVLFGAGSMEELVVNSRYFREIINHDQNIIKNYKDTLKELNQLREKRNNILKNSRRLRRQIQKSLNQLEETKKRRQKVLGEIRNRRDFYNKRIEELQQRQNKLKNVVIELQKEQTMTKARLERLTHEFAREKGKIPWPVDSRKILRPFGRWREGEIVHKNDGIDIEVAEGAEVRAVAPGDVIFARPYRGMGKVVIIRHNESFITLYGSLVEVNVERGDEVGEGKKIGKAGQTVGLQEPRLYFQIFEGRNILDPTHWLK
jgi:septal ring factor EnvC (AmiA/AmiB activator)